jgi:hypothetical protein
MHIHLFEKLNLNVKACTAWKKGVHIGYRSEGAYYMSLYRLHDFYVEIQYHTCHDGIAGVKTIVCEEQLQAYLDQIDLNTLL